jgi:hypothetical protein
LATVNMTNLTGEVGRIGQKRVGGFYSEEFLKELKGRKGMEVYKEMTNNDEVIGAIDTVIELIIRQVTWTVEAGGKKTTADEKAAEFVKSCLDDMKKTWTDTISEVLSFLDFGWSYHELVYKFRRGSQVDPRYRSKYDDGLIGWAKLPIRAQDTLWEWQVDNEDNLLGMTQLPPPTYQLLTVPIEKALHFRTTSAKDNPEGRSMWRRAYRPWYFKRRIQEIEGIGIERDLAGLPVLKPPENTDIYNTTDPEMVKSLAWATKTVTSIRRDSMEGVVLPYGWELTLLNSGGRRNFDTSAIIERYDTRIAMLGLADFMLLGHQKVGSFALSSDKTELFTLALKAFLGIICEVFNNQAIPRLIDLNAAFKGITGYPILKHGDVEAPDLKDLGAFIKDMTSVAVITPGPELERFVRQAANLPEEAETYLDRQPRGQQKPTANNTDEGEEVEDLEDAQRAAEAKKRLGRGDDF